jgi:hypothetical protein
MLTLVNIFQVSGETSGITRGSNSPYKRRKAVLEDPESGHEVELTAWNKNTALLDQLQPGAHVTVKNVLTEHFKGAVSIRATSSMEVEVSIFTNLHVAYFTT